MVKTSNIFLFFIFMIVQYIVAFDFQQPEIVLPSIAEIKNYPLKYEKKIVRITGWLEKGCRFGGNWIENDEDYISIMSFNDAESDIVTHKDRLYEEFWNTCTDYDLYNPCKKDVEVEIEGIVKENKEVIKEWIPDGNIVGILIVTRVIRIEEKYRKPPEGICIPETLEEMLERYHLDPVPKIDLPKPELNLELKPIKIN